MIWRSCALLAVIGLLLQGSQGGHMLLVEHTRCAEHGELVHGDGAHEARTVSAQPVESRTIEHASDLDESAHDHCSHASERRDAVAEVTAPDRIGRCNIQPKAPTPNACAPVERTSLYRTAPKTSPPA